MEMGGRSGGQILIDALRINGTDRIFCVPGESYLAALDALHESPIQLVVCRQEGGAAYMADAYGKLTGRPGVCFVTRGPGASNAAAGIHTARQDSTPLLLFVGQVARGDLEREAFQEVDFRQMFAPLAKWVVQIDDAARIPELVARAYRVALSGRPGPVVVALPEDMLRDVVEVGDAPAVRRVAPGFPSPDDMAALRAMLEGSVRPLMVVGGSSWSDAARADIRRFSEKFAIPVAAAFRRQDVVNNTAATYVGDLSFAPHEALARGLREADLILAVGTRLGDVSTGGYALIEPPIPPTRLIHIHEGVEELGRVYQPVLAINAGIEAFAAAAAGLAPFAGPVPWARQTEALREGYVKSLLPEPTAGAVNLGEIIRHLSDRLPDDAIITNGAGNYAGWLHRFYSYRGGRTELAPTNGSMGYGVPAAVAAKLTRPDSIVVCFAGDGCFLMNGQELATAVQYGAAAIFVVINNGMYGTIRMHQERNYPARVVGTTLHNPDFVALARAYGLEAEQVLRTADFMPAFERILAGGKPGLIEVVIDPESLSPKATLSQIRARAQQAQAARQES